MSANLFVATLALHLFPNNGQCDDTHLRYDVNGPHAKLWIH